MHNVSGGFVVFNDRLQRLYTCFVVAKTQVNCKISWFANQLISDKFCSLPVALNDQTLTTCVYTQSHLFFILIAAQTQIFYDLIWLN